MATPLTRKSSGWFKGCGCGQKPGDKVEAPAGSVEGILLFGSTSSEQTGPVSGIKYQVTPNHIAIDLDPRDYDAWKAQQKAIPGRSGMKGVLSRIPSAE